MLALELLQTVLVDDPDRPTPPGDIVDRVRDELDRRLAGNAYGGVDEIAKALGLSRRTLQRRLRERRHSLSRIIAEVRLERALRMLGTGVPTKRAARDCGYGDVTAFHRAFRRWTGATPGQVGEELRADGSSPPREA